jgi:hypothetical protein
MLLNDKYLESNPTWWKNINSKDYYLVLGDDMDSFLSCYYLQKKFDIPIGGFYSFSKGFYTSTAMTEFDLWWRHPLFIDVCVKEGKCFDNHYSYLMHENQDMFTFNRDITVYDYNQKYNGGVLPMLVSLYEDDLSDKTEDFFLNLLCTDGFYRGVYNCGGKYASVNYQWFRALGLYDYLKPICDKYDADFFQQRIDDMSLNRKFEVNDEGYIVSRDKQTSKLPKEKFVLDTPVEQGRADDVYMKIFSRERKIFSAARVYKNTYQYSYLVS